MNLIIRGGVRLRVTESIESWYIRHDLRVQTLGISMASGRIIREQIEAQRHEGM